MGSMPMYKLLLSMGLPMVLSLMLQALYNIVDSIFVSNMVDNSDAGMNALAIVFPMQMLMVALTIGTGVGVGALVSHCLGRGDFEKANQTSGNAIFLGGVIFLIFICFGLFGVSPYIACHTQDSLSAEKATSYLKICCFASFGIAYFGIFEKLLQAAAHPLCSTIAQVTGAVINMILDPIMIYGWLGCPKMGINGAALATVIGQIASMCLGMFFHFKYNKEIKIKKVHIKPNGALIKEIYAIGLPAIIAQALTSLMTFGLNIVLYKVSVEMQTAYGTFYKIQQFVLFAAFGLRDAITPIVAFSYGMQSRERIKSAIKYGLLYVGILMLVGIFVIEIGANAFANVFGLEDVTGLLFISAMRIISLSFLCAGINIVMQGVFQALEGGKQSLVVSICRQTLFVFPFAVLFVWLVISGNANEWTVWTTFPIAEGITIIFASFMLHRIYAKKVNSLAG